MKRALIGLFFLGGCAPSRDYLKTPVIGEDFSTIAVKASAPAPEEIKDESQARVVACGAAAGRAQTALLDHVLNKRVSGGKTLAEAEIPYIEMQTRIRTLIRSAQVINTSVRDKFCTVTLAISKSELKAIIRDPK